VGEELNSALRIAIQMAKARGAEVIEADDLLVGCLAMWSRFGMVTIGNFAIDLETLGYSWLEAPPESGAKPAYSDSLVALLDRAAALARIDHAGRPGVVHVLACFANVGSGLMGKLRETYGIDSASWRAGLAQADARSHAAQSTSAAQPAGERPYLTPEEAALYLGVHIQTIRGYIRSGKLPALRIAGGSGDSFGRRSSCHYSSFKENCRGSLLRC
jgi:excisionase family DNA binding protein